MPPKNSRAKPVVDAPAGGSDPAGKTSPSKGKEIVDNLPSEAEVTAGSSGLTLEEKLKALATVVSGDSFIEDDSDEELDIDATKSSYPHLRFTAILLFSVIPSREVALVILTVKTLMKRVWSNLLTDDVLASVKFQELLPAFVAKTRYSRLQVSFLHESDAVNIKQTTVEHKRQNGTTLHCFWLHQEDAAYLRKKALSPQLLEVFFKNVPADIPLELVKEIMVAHPLKIRKQSAFAEGHCFHRVLHPVTGADTDKIKGLVIPHAGDKHRWRHEFRHQLLGGTTLCLSPRFRAHHPAAARRGFCADLHGKQPGGVAVYSRMLREGPWQVFHGGGRPYHLDHILLGLEKLGTATRGSLERLGLHVIRKEFGI
ncbi:unnamed protein product [Closterium sp. Naga37s-1]|nr:unnamed protein product [Closterium sp. Naga37s-1]